MKLNRTILDMKALSILAGLGLSAALPASDAVWKSAADGDWMTAANWVDDVMPSSTARACFTNDTAAYTVTLNTAEPQTAQGLVISGQVEIVRLRDVRMHSPLPYLPPAIRKVLAHVRLRARGNLCGGEPK